MSKNLSKMAGMKSSTIKTCIHQGSNLSIPFLSYLVQSLVLGVPSPFSLRPRSK